MVERWNYYVTKMNFMPATLLVKVCVGMAGHFTAELHKNTITLHNMVSLYTLDFNFIYLVVYNNSSIVPVNYQQVSNNGH